MTTEDHFSRLLRLLAMEAQAEAEQMLARIRRGAAGGEGLRGLVVDDEAAGLGGHLLVRLTHRDRTRPLPWHRLRPGTPVLLSEEGATSSQGVRGVVSDRGERFLEIAVEELPDEESERPSFRVDLANDEVARRRQKEALERGRDAGGRLGELRRVLLGETAPEFDRIVPIAPLAPLNHSQREAVEFALSARDIAVLHGPPGTGKTTAVVELIRQAIRRGEKVLACAPSNLAVDNMLEKLLGSGVKAVRLGHPARVLPELRAATLDALAEAHPDTKLARSMLREAVGLMRQASKWTRARPEPGARRELRQRARELRADARRVETQVVERLLAASPAILATTTGLSADTLGKLRFDRAVIDEACQTTEPGCWIPLLWADRLTLAGDHCQLPPTVVSAEAQREGFGVSLQERLVAAYGTAITRRLDTQYRMNRLLMQFSSDEFYQGELKADESVANHVLSGLPGVQELPETLEPVRFLDTAGAGHVEEVEPEGESRLNGEEAAVVTRQVKKLLEAGLPARDIAVITPYAAQAKLLRERLATPELEVDTIDGFQGREKEAVVLSLVRSNERAEIGFLADVRRMNVALTRARRRLVVIGDSATIASHPFYGRLLAYYGEIGAHGTVWDDVE